LTALPFKGLTKRETPFHEVELLSTAGLYPSACEDST